MLSFNHVRFRYEPYPIGSAPEGSRLKRLLRGDSGSNTPVLSARFEFSMLPANGGFIRPHTDSPHKIITLVVAMLNEGEWNPEFGGGTEVLRPRDITKN